MAEPCLPDIDKLKLVRDGSEQGDRFPRPLDPQSVPVHGRAPEHSMLFAREYAAFLRYYSASNEYKKGETWQAFFNKDVSVALAAAAVQDVDRYRRVILLCFRTLEDRDNASSPEVIRRSFGFIFGAIGTLVTQLDSLKATLPDDIPLKATLVNLIQARLRSPLKRFVSWFNEDHAMSADLRLIEPDLVVPEPPDDHEVSILGIPPFAFPRILAPSKPLSADWLGQETWDQFRISSSAPSVYGGKTTVFERANTCAGHNLFTGACDQFLRAYARIVTDAKAELALTLKSYDRHDPHYALFLAFLRMFEYARADINALGGKHLDFYYRDVLKLAPRTAKPCGAHVVVELGKNVDSYELPETSEFKAGKDAQKKLVVFTSDEALVANKAVVSSIRSLYRDSEADAIYVNAAAETAGRAWSPFETRDEIGSFGFSIASHYLYLAEGTRTVTLTVALAASLDNPTDLSAIVHDAFLCRFTTAKGWLEVRPSAVAFKTADTLVITVELDGDQPGITAYDARTHASSYETALPVLEVRLGTVASMLSRFRALEALLIRSIKLNVEVTGLRSLAISTDRGPADASKPFQPFGPAPVRGSSCVIGCQEAFSKKGIDNLELSLNWRTDATSIKALVLRLSGGRWEGSSEVDLKPQPVPLIVDEVVFNADDDPSLTFAAPFSLKATSGYVKLSLSSPFGHAAYAANIVAYVIDQVTGKQSKSAGDSRSELLMEALGDKPTAFPSEPHAPELESISLKYSASQLIDCGATDESAFRERKGRFYHVTSWGLGEQHGYLRAHSEQKDISLLPSLSHANVLDPAIAGGKGVPHEGELYIGLGGVVAPQNVALLFQVVDGSADPLAEKPSPHLHYSYLRSGDWVAFTAERVSDRTSELLGSGIITFSIPADATTRDTLLPGGLTWIRIAVGRNTRAVCRLLAVRAQAVSVTFADRGNDPAFLATPLAAGAINKLMTPVAAIKSVGQPYESFGSRTHETAKAFRTRVSERLRHKDRAIALWDIERLVLEAFPGIHRVKCLNHTRYEPTSSAVVYQELAAGHVTVVTIPAVSKGYAADPLTPYTSLGVLEEIKAYLVERLSCFGTLHVRNPAYERLLVDCRVRLHKGFDQTYSLNQLKTSITRFLAPWAFDDTRRPTFGGRLYRSAVVNFLEEQDCVDYVTDFRLYREVSHEAESEALAVVEGTRAISVLASVPAEQHRIAAIDEKHAPREAADCGCAP